ncbi:(5-formylfuran-3-yl)methyl phosphate synthase [Stieleria neptunia]|uniref:(5-formylfuran-3-yl)methyl phosphate synthase n=1 Tax=Stieleria neptunia TaxID=2527979 RepID=UPI0018D24948|nr:(5-formylfuran-3-yl)methyl phosphate synthase [Stieleria neptunia]
MKPEWLVSVRDLAEAKRAVEFDVAILDFKEPRRGALAPVAVQIWRQVASWASAGKDGPLLSAALGESDQAVGLADQLPPEFAFAKAGPSGCNDPDQTRGMWDAVRARLPDRVELVAVAYADHRSADCLPAEQILDLAARHGFRRILLDTCEKNGRSSIDLLGSSRLLNLGRQAHQQLLWWSLAGSITRDQVAGMAKLIPPPEFRPDCFAVRGDVCDGDRIGTLCPDKMRQWMQMLH